MEETGRSTMTENRAIAVYELDTGQVELRVDAANDTVWATQADMASIFDVDQSVISRHIKNVYEEDGLDPKSTMQKMHSARSTKPVNSYSLDIVISVGYRVNSLKATQFRKWATRIIKEYSTEGYALNVSRLENDPAAFADLYVRVRKIRLSEREMYRKVTDVFKESAVDYDSNSPSIRSYFAMIQDKFHYAVTQKTAAEIILERASADKPNMGLLSMTGEYPTFEDAQVGKNYLTADELAFLENIAEQFLLFCESAAMRGKQMTFEELSTRLNMLFMANEYAVLYEYQSYKRGLANDHVKRELDRYRSLPGTKASRSIQG